VEAAIKSLEKAGSSFARGPPLALVFEKPSTRTRLAFEIGMLRLGGQVVFLRPEDVQLGQREAIRDVARVLTRYVDGIAMRTFTHATLEEVARHASVPVINGLSDLHHHCQALSDLLTLRERFQTLQGLTVGYVGAGTVEFLVDADTAEDAIAVHRDAHGLVADEIYAVTEHT